MKGFQIWHHNLNRIAFHALYDPETDENWLNRVFCQFSTVFGQKSGQMLFDLTFNVVFGILSLFSIYRDPICYYFHILKLFASMLLFDQNILAGPTIFFEKM